MTSPARGTPAPPPHVCFVADSDAWGGAEVYLCHHVRRAAANGWQATLLAAEPVAGRFREVLRPDAVTTVPLVRHGQSAPVLEDLLPTLAPDVVHVNLVDPGSNAAAVRAAAAVAPTAGTLHLRGDTGEGVGRRRLVELYRRLALVLTPAEEIRQQVLDELEVPPERVVRVWNGVDVPVDPAGPAGPAGGTVPRVGVHGRLTEQKGFDVLLEAVGKLVADGEQLEVVIGGAGRCERQLRDLAEGLPVSFPGFVHDARAFLGGLDLFVLSSRREALPLALMEAMAEGLPCVTTDVGDVRPAVGDAAVVVPVEDADALGEAVRRLLRSPRLRAELGERARRRVVGSLNADRMASQTYASLRALLPSARTG